jgi:PAS domain S-box-containing protein
MAFSTFTGPAQEMSATLNVEAAYLAAIVESSHDAIISKNLAGIVTTWNRAAAAMFGYQAEEIVGRPVSVLFPSDRFDEEGLILERIFRGERIEHFETRRRHKDGRDVPVSLTISPIRDPTGTIIGASKIARDITERNRTAEEALRKSEERLRRVIEATPNALVTIRMTGQIEMVNAQAERMFGYSRDELLGQPVEMLVPERFRRHHPELRNFFFGDPRSRPMGAGRDLYGLKKDGSEFPVEIGLNPIETDEGTMVLSAIVDISTRKRLEERFRRVVESAPNAMVMINAAGGIEMVNAQAQHVFGYSREELLGQPVEMLVPERFRRHHPRLRASFFGDPQSRPMGAGRDLYGLKKDGSEFPVEIGLNPLETEEGPMVLSAIVDISDRKHREESIQAALKEKDILLGEIHHRVKNNLQVIHSLLDLQSLKVDDETALQLLRESQNRIRSMSLIHQTLYESKDFARVDFRSFLDTLVPTLVSSYSADPSRITLLIDAAEVSVPINAAIPCGLIVNELISNALKHAFPGGRHGEIRIGLARDESEQVELSVSDNGVGIPEELDLANASTLGLQLVALLADQLSAEILIQRANPTRFVLHLAAAQ